MTTGSTQSPGDRATASPEEKVGALRSPLAYDERPRSIQVVETHFAWIFLADEYAFNLKKPVRAEHLDLTAPAARLFNCSEELRLNRRLAPDVYLGIVPLMRSPDGSLHVGGPGVVVDWLVKMRRLPSAMMLDAAIASGKVDCEALVAVGRMLAPELSIAPVLVEAVAAVQSSARTALELELMLRVRQQRIVEAHGDLRPEHICLSDPPCVIDSLEFSQDLRTLDPGEELAFLWVECARLGSAWVGKMVLDAYRAQSGDPIASQLLDFYRSRRATVRAKLVAWHLRDPAVSQLADWSRQAQEYLARSPLCNECA